VTASELDQLSINTLRFLAVDAVQNANSGHPGLPLDAAPMAYVLWTRFLEHNPADPSWLDRDRFVLSAGHGSALLYALLHLTGYPEMTLDQLKRFRQWQSLTPGHPESHLTHGVETSMGPLGQGISNAVGGDRPHIHRGSRAPLRGLWLARPIGRGRQRPRGNRRGAAHGPGGNAAPVPDPRADPYRLRLARQAGQL
jgi:hypothetical protein